jgi:hypothetical protein
MINDLSDLKKLLKLCRMQGVTEINLGGTCIKFGDLPAKRGDEDTEDSEVPTDGLTPEQLMFFSAGGTNENYQG